MHGVEHRARVALIHEFLLNLRGAERVLIALAAAFPAAPVKAILYSRTGMAELIDPARVSVSPLGRIPGPSGPLYRTNIAWSLFRRTVSRIDVGSPDLVISNSCGFAHGVKVDPGTRHLCYCHAPFRYAWHETDAVGERHLSSRQRRSNRRMRAWNCVIAADVSSYLVPSRYVQAMLAEFWDQPSRIVHPPVRTARVHSRPPKDYFLVVAPLIRHKRVAVVLHAAELSGNRVIVVGDGPERRALSRRFRSAQFLGRVSEERLDDLYAQARALVVPKAEEFGLCAVEAQAAGRPVLALAAGGQLETIEEGRTGILVDRATPAAFAEAMNSVDWDGFDTRLMRQNALRFSEEVFAAEVQREASRLLAERSKSAAPVIAAQ